MIVAVPRDRDSRYQFHDEKRTAIFGRAAVENPGDIRVVHQGERLSLTLESRDDLLRVHTGSDDFQRHLPTNGLALFGEPHDPKTTLADLSHQRIISNVTGRFEHGGRT